MYCVGGYVRNSISGLGNTDIDICGDKLSTDLSLPQGATLKIVQRDLGTATICIDGDVYEYTPFRSEEYINGNHRPCQVQFGVDMYMDCMRRDFACNAIYYDLHRHELIDMCNGVSDCKDKVLRVVNDRVFDVDGLRIMRMVRIAAETGYSIDRETLMYAKSKLYLLYDISVERKRLELDRLLRADVKYGVPQAHCVGLQYLIDCDILQYIDAGLADISIQTMLNSMSKATVDVRLIVLMYYCTNRSHVLDNLRYSNAIKHQVLTVLQACDAYNDNMTDIQCRQYCVECIGTIKLVVQLMQAIDVNVDKIAAQLLYIEHNNVPINVRQLKLNGTDLVQSNIPSIYIGNILYKLLQLCVEEPRLNNRRYLLTQAQLIAHDMCDGYSH
jgi:tRNA nucleotidyltransferase/poly(A) polymerase